MTIYVINGNEDKSARKKKVDAFVNNLDSANPGAVIKLEYLESHHDKNAVDDLRYAYKENDYDFYVYSLAYDADGNDAIERLVLLCNITNENDIKFVNL